MAFHDRAAIVLLCLASCLARAADVCPAPPKYTYTRPPDLSIDDHRIFLESDGAEMEANGSAVLNGRVTARCQVCNIHRPRSLAFGG